MLTKRIIPCLDVTDGMVVKGVRFRELEEVGDPVAMARRYYEEGADELVFLDITATVDGRRTMMELVERVASEVFVPLTVGGGVRTVEDMGRLIRSGAEKVAVNTAAVDRPSFITEAARIFGSQAVVVAIDARRGDEGWYVTKRAGRTPTELDVLEWSVRVEELGGGEILLTSMDRDGTRQGYDLELTRAVSDAVNIPVIASGGAGGMETIADVLERGGADAALAASLFHRDAVPVSELRNYLSGMGLDMRC